MSYATLRNKIQQLIKKVENNEASNETITPFVLSDSYEVLTSRIISVDCAKGNFLPVTSNWAKLFSNMNQLQEIKNFSIAPNVMVINQLFWQCYLKSAPVDWAEFGQQLNNIRNGATTFGRAFGSNYTDVILPNFNWANATTLQNVLYDNQEITLDLSGWTFPKITAAPSIYWNHSLTTLNLDGWDFSNITSFLQPHWLAQDWQLSSIQGNFSGLGNKMDTVSFAGTYMNYTSDKPHVGFDTDTVTRIINALVTKTDDGEYSLILSPNTEPNVTEEQIAAAQAKNWTIKFA